VDKERLSPSQAISAVHAAGGVAVLAHPSLLKLASAAEYRTSVGHWKDQGLDGIEVYHPEHSIAQTRMFLDLARSLKLLLSGGSDFHGWAKPDVRLGLPRVPAAAVEQLLEKLAR
jgi:predicted metal-dependent phosphoesterase TrpH